MPPMSDRSTDPIMRFCPYCGRTVQPTYNYCAYCGQSLVSVTQRKPHGEADADPTLTSPDRRSLTASSSRNSRIDALGSSIRKIASNISSFFDRPLTWPPSIETPSFLTRDVNVKLRSREISFSITLALEVSIVVALTTLAAWMRIEGLADPSPGINIDESTYAAEIHRIVSGEWIGKFSGASLGVPTLQFYVTAPLFMLIESELFAIRIVSAVAGTLIIPIAHLFMRRFFPFTVVVVTTALTAFSVYFMLESRIGWPLMLAVLELFTGLTLLVFSVQYRKPRLALIGGIILGAGMYTHQVFLPFWAASISLAILAALIHPVLKHRRELYIFAAACLITGVNMAWFLLFEFDFVSDLENHYGVSASIDPVRYARRAVEVFMFFRSPISADFTDAAPSAPIFTGIFQLLFIIGIVTAILRIKDYRYQMLVIGLLVAMVPAIVVPGSEARRFMIGMFFMSAFVALGFTVVMQLVSANIGVITELSSSKLIDLIRRSVYVVALAVLVLVAAYSGYNRLDEWKSKDARWVFNYDLAHLANFIKDFDDSHTVHLYSDRSQVPNTIIDWVAPHLVVVDGAETHVDGERELKIPHTDNGPIIVALLESYVEHGQSLREEFPDAHFVEHVDEYDQRIWNLLVIRDS